ncbi:MULTISPECIES: metallophosphoesterase [Arthrobacter]|uniref:Metallophosphoesterase n=2 Tax=Arthrobacter TaxID=1663 RepID=A0ABU9KNB3_9MICC|nr:metallophosphoesterase [Arthrobacter sp. YJM1]MDP5227595.1 metallophosphoesterase [Arthrobacter sp. YJM1]
MSDFAAMASRVRDTGRGFAAGAAKTALLLGAAGAAGLAYGSWEKDQFGVRREKLAILPESSAPFRILHLSDIHFVPGQTKKAEWLRSLDAHEPDLVVNTGDNLSHKDAIDPLLDALRPLLERPGVFVAGSNDYYGPRMKSPLSYFSGPSRQKPKPVELDWPKLRSGFGMAGWVDLNNRNQSLVFNRMRFDFTGMDDPHLKRERFAGWPQGSASTTAPSVRIGVVHAPYQRALDALTEAGSQLILAGHTHGGQVCIPGFGALVSNCDLPTWRARGLHDWESNGSTTPVNVSAGIGTSRFAPYRVACRPEAVILDLVAKA